MGILTDVNKELEGTDQVVAQRARNLLRREIDFTRHVSLPAITVELKRNNVYVNLAKIIHAFTSSGLPQHVICFKL